MGGLSKGSVMQVYSEFLCVSLCVCVCVCVCACVSVYMDALNNSYRSFQPWNLCSGWKPLQPSFNPVINLVSSGKSAPTPWLVGN